MTFNTIFCHPDILEQPSVQKVLQAFPGVPVVPHVTENHPGHGLLLTRNQGTFIKPCPGQKGNVCCGYWVVEWGLGCIYRCHYCVLQYYLQPGDVTWFMNWEKLYTELDDLRRNVSGRIRLGTGEFGDSLALEHLFPLHAELIARTARLDGVTLEIKTKSAAVSSLAEAEPHDHVLVAFSMNPPCLTSAIEPGTATLEERIKAAQQVSSWGYRLALHFDPLIPIPGWQDHYGEVMRRLAHELEPSRVAWISLGSFRFPRGFQEKAERNYPGTPIFTEEFYPCSDGKMRYFRPLREALYTFMRKEALELFPQAHVYTCMESPEVWERLCGKAWTSGDLTRFLNQAVS